MEKNSPINSVYLIALACCSLITLIYGLQTALIYAVVIVATYLVSLSVVSMIEKITDNHVRFIIYALVSVAIITILKIVCSYVNIQSVVLAGEHIEFTILPCMILAIYPIYFEDTFKGSQYFVSILIQAGVTLLTLCLYGAIIEMLGFGMIWGKEIGFEGLDFFTKPYGAFFIIATLCVIFNMFRRAYLKKTRRYRTLVDKYKIVITEIRDSELRKKEIEKNEVEGGRE